MLCTADATGEVLAALLRPGDAGTTTVADHLQVLDAAVAQLPTEIAVGHRRDDDAESVHRSVRTDSAGCSGGFVWGCRARNIGFAVVARSNPSSAPPSPASWPTRGGGRPPATKTALSDPERRWRS
ncbi:MAG: hypothetical protein M3179_08120 [Actinomycetota bacterium]|nr:hypothetical protein [Actinomycetota bacterium]